MFADETNHTKIKICGLTNLEDARFASGALAHYLGFIFYQKSPRYIEPAKAGAIINWIEGPECVGVFVNQPLDDVNMTARQTGVDLVQLHGTESPEYCRMVDKPIIKVIHVEEGISPGSLKEITESYLDAVDYLMFDTRVQNKWGGTGQTFNWELIKDISGEVPFFLSGGLHPGNVRKAIETVHPYAVDISSGLEAEPGIKDFEKIELLMEEMRSIWEEQELK